MKKLIALVLCLVAGMCITTKDAEIDAAVSMNAVGASAVELHILNAEKNDLTMILVHNMAGKLIDMTRAEGPIWNIYTSTYPNGIYKITAKRETRALEPEPGEPTNEAKIVVNNGVGSPRIVELKR